MRFLDSQISNNDSNTLHQVILNLTRLSEEIKNKKYILVEVDNNSNLYDVL